MPRSLVPILKTMLPADIFSLEVRMYRTYLVWIKREHSRLLLRTEPF